MSDDFETLLNEAEDLTKRDLDARIASLVRLRPAEVRSLFPRHEDKVRLVELMQIVREAAADNRKKRELIENISAYADVVVKLLARFA